MVFETLADFANMPLKRKKTKSDWSDNGDLPGIFTGFLESGLKSTGTAS